MISYELYVESGPKKRKTQAHVLALLGCIAEGPATGDALAATSDAIRAYLRFLQRHGGDADPEAPFTTRVAVHVMEGVWLGQGDPYPGFAPDFETLSESDLRTYRQRLAWMQSDLVKLAGGLSDRQLGEKPETGRPIRVILEHIAGADYAYLQSPLSKPEGLSAALAAITESDAAGLPAALDRFWSLAASRLDALTPAERKEQVAHGQKIWTARRALRRMLEHRWEHLSEITRRLG